KGVYDGVAKPRGSIAPPRIPGNIATGWLERRRVRPVERCGGGVGSEQRWPVSEEDEGRVVAAVLRFKP
ncbi:hypothetical protein A2U01_0079685, partial [Trifolium medium]|nr:hypothetical protein [Trifolium medium]